MRVFVAGASGAIGRRLVPQLSPGATRSSHRPVARRRRRALRALGAEPVVMDGLDAAIGGRGARPGRSRRWSSTR